MTCSEATPRLLFVSCILVAGFCGAQVQVNAYIPDAAVVSFGNRTAFNRGRIFVVDTATNQLVGPPISVGFLPAGVSVTPDGRYAYITNNGSNSITVIDTVSRAVLGSINVPTGALALPAAPTPRKSMRPARGLFQIIAVLPAIRSQSLTQRQIRWRVPLRQERALSVSLSPRTVHMPMWPTAGPILSR
jgi:YVTN family beta-propeller protein